VAWVGARNHDPVKLLDIAGPRFEGREKARGKRKEERGKGKTRTGAWCCVLRKGKRQGKGEREK
jgi:hypothetical protein